MGCKNDDLRGHLRHCVLHNRFWYGVGLRLNCCRKPSLGKDDSSNRLGVRCPIGGLINTRQSMVEFDRRVFADLLNAVVTKCFDRPLKSPLSEPESKHPSHEIQESTGLVTGWRSIKN